MTKTISKDHPRVPEPHEGLQVNFCKNAQCNHFGSLASPEKQSRGRGNKSRDGYSVDNKGGFRSILVCKVCGQYSIMKSNQAVYEEYSRISSYLNKQGPVSSCKNKDCLNHQIDVSVGKKHYRKVGTTSTGAQRYLCKACNKTFSVNTHPATRQRTSHKNRNIFKLLVNKMPFKRICEVEEIGPPTLYRKIDFIHSQCLVFAASRERLIPTLEIPRLYIASDRQEFSVNWKDSRDKRNTILKAITSVDSKSSYVFAMNSNFDPRLNPALVAIHAEHLGDMQKLLPFRRYARLWLDEDYARLVRGRDHFSLPIPEGGLERDVANRYRIALTRNEIEATDDPEPHIMLPEDGLQVHEEYTLYGHFLFLKKMLKNVEKFRFFLDQDSGMRAACFAAFRDDILEGNCDAFFVRINKDLTVNQKRRIVGQVERELDKARFLYPDLTDTSIRILGVIEEMEKMEKIGRWEDRWLKYPFPDMSEPEKAVCHLTPINVYENTHMANLYLKASLHAVDSYFNQVRTHISPLQRANRSQSSSGRTWYGYQPYQPELVQKLLDIFRVFHNYCLESKIDKKTPAMRLGLAKGPVDLDKIIYFSE